MVNIRNNTPRNQGSDRVSIHYGPWLGQGEGGGA